jgi:hypothetical protein
MPVRGNVGGRSLSSGMSDPIEFPAAAGGGVAARTAVGDDAASRAEWLRASLGAVLDSVEQAERIAGVTAAARAELIDAARRTSEAVAAEDSIPGEHGSGALGSEPEGWNAATRARRELVFDLAVRLHIPERTAERLIAESKRLVGSLPETKEALGAGEISYRHVQVIVDETAGLSDIVSAEFEKQVLPKARELTVAKFKAAARKKREALHPETIEARHSAAVADRSVWVDPQHDGMAVLSALLPAETAVAIHDRITRIALANGGTDPDTGSGTGTGTGSGTGSRASEAAADAASGSGQPFGPGPKRTLAQRRADAFADLLLDGDLCPTGDPAPHGIRPHVLVTVPVLTLLGQTGTPAHLDGYGPISPDTARTLAATAPSFARILTDPVTSAILDFDRSKYAVPADLKQVVRLQHDTCTAPGCNKRAVHCHLDHTQPFGPAGSTGTGTGTTSLANLSPLCAEHHNLKHHARIGLAKLPDGTMQWTTATGKTITVTPSNLLGDDMLRRGSPAPRGDGPPGADHQTSPPDDGSAAPPGAEWDQSPPPDHYPF